MKYQNITLSIPKDILKKIKMIAVEKNTSVSGLLTQELIKIARKEDAYEKSMARQYHLLKKGFNMGINKKIPWKKDELHER
ncbi:MAG: CopG family transcriptional regulator [Firmicutes bacterium HGW-Firmicutes-13]|nr:MAG: CopG family transcriptional regulator [Firmicutes bacterium HGW-Firmicutes-13]